MQPIVMRNFSRDLLLMAAAILLPACSPTTSGISPRTMEVAEAFESSGTVTIRPYERSIFNTENF